MADFEITDEDRAEAQFRSRCWTITQIMSDGPAKDIPFAGEVVFAWVDEPDFPEAAGEIPGKHPQRMWRIEDVTAWHDRELSAAQLAERLGVSVPTIHRYINRDDFPAPAREVGNARVWKLGEVLAWHYRANLSPGRPSNQ